MAAVIQEKAKRLARLVDNLLDLSRLEAGAAEPRREWASIEELIRAAVSEVGVAPGAFSLSIDRDLPLVSVDPVQWSVPSSTCSERRRRSGGHPVSVRARAVRRLAGAPAAASPAERDLAGSARPRAVGRPRGRTHRRPRPGHPPASSSACSSRSIAPARQQRPPRLRARAGDRAGLHRGERRDAARRVASPVRARRSCSSCR